MHDDDIYCAWSGCKMESVMGYSPTPKHKKVLVCQTHWHKICEAEGHEYGKAMLRLGYVGIQDREHRSSDEGDVVMAVAGKTKKSKTDKRKVGEAWVDHFRTNAGCSSKDRLTDPQIQKAMKKEFPTRESWEFTNERGVSRARKFYNQGGFTGKVPPRKLSDEYDKSGTVVVITERRGRPKSNGRISSTGTVSKGKKQPGKKSVKKSTKAKKA